jgi:hypothetical protein
MTTDPRPATLTVVLAPHGEADDILGLLVDYSAVGLLDPFIWVTVAARDKTSVPATLVAGGHASSVILQEVLTGRRRDRVRIAALVPVDAPADQQIPRADEQALEQVVRAGAVGTPITLLRVLFTHGAAGPAGYDANLVSEGWHNLLVAPEDSAGPGLGSVVLDRLTDPLEVAQHVAPVVASVAGLWSGIDRVAFDDLAILPGTTVRAVRAFYRELDAAEAEDKLRLTLFDSTGRLPLPRGGTVPVVYVQDDALATQTVARALWTKHRDVLRGRRTEVTREAPAAISVWSAVKIFLSFLWAAMRNAPSAWLSSLLGSVSSTLATTVQHSVFGRSDSAFAVVTRGDVGNWQDIGRGADEMSTLLGAEPGRRQLAQVDLAPLWVDYINGALTLADGGRRAAGIEPVSVGAGIGVLRKSAGVVPSAAEAFTEVPGSLAAVIGVAKIAGGDVIGAEDLKSRLERTFGDSAAGIEARQTFAKLTDWEATTGRSYATQTGSILADFLGRARAEVAELVQQIRETANRPAAADKLRRRQRVIATITRTAGWTVFATLMLLLAIAAVDWVSWTFSFLVGGLTAAAYLVAALILFILGQRHLFAELNLRQSQDSELEAMHSNLRAALQDIRRMSAAYGQLLSWNRVLGEVLRAPFGPVEPALPTRPHIQDGLPRSVQIGVAAPGGGDAESTASSLQQQLYPTGWLTGPWEQMLESATRRSGEKPSALFPMPGVGSGSALDEWSQAVAAGVVHAEGADSLWTRVVAMFDDPDSPIAGALTAGIFNPVTEQRMSPAEFNGGIPQRRAGPAAPFDAALFTDTAATAGRSGVAHDDTAIDRNGLGYRAVVVQAGEGLPAYDFALFASQPAVSVAADDDDTPPESEALVF